MEATAGGGRARANSSNAGSGGNKPHASTSAVSEGSSAVRTSSSSSTASSAVTTTDRGSAVRSHADAAEVARLRNEIDAARSALAAASNRARDAETLAHEASERAAAAAAERDAAVNRATIADAARAAADAAASDHQRRRLEAKAELVRVAAALEMERRAASSLAGSLGTLLLPRLDALGDGLHNLAATLDPSYAPPPPLSADALREVVLAVSAASGASPPAGATRTRRATSSHSSGGDGGVPRPPQQQGQQRPLVGRGAAGSPLGGGALRADGSIADTTADALRELLDEADVALFAATRSAVAIVRSGQGGRGGVFSSSDAATAAAAAGAGSRYADSPPAAGCCMFLRSLVGLGGRSRSPADGQREIDTRDPSTPVRQSRPRGSDDASDLSSSRLGGASIRRENNAMAMQSTHRRVDGDGGPNRLRPREAEVHARFVAPLEFERNNDTAAAERSRSESRVQWAAKERSDEAVGLASSMDSTIDASTTLDGRDAERAVS